jgi:uncharacterized protein with ParB-like and HNH nuclease domain
MDTPKETIRKMIGYLNNSEKEGGFWLPNIQRNFVWSEEQIERLFDSILREYPIGTLLVWKTKSPIRRRKFIDNYRRSISLAGYFVPEDDKTKLLVLDGQQRLQSLFIGLRGSYEGKELYFDILSGSLAAPDDIKYKFEFRVSDATKLPWIKFKDLVVSNEKTSEALKRLVAEFAAEGRLLNEDQKNKIEENVEQVFETFRNRDTIVYQQLDSIDRPQLYTEDDVVEIFIRANSGGTRLGKSELLFSLLTASWEDANDRIEDLLKNVNRLGFGYSRDFVLKVCLTLLDHGARYEVSKFRQTGIREKIEANWNSIAAAIADVADYVRGRTFIRCDKALPSYLALIPFIYCRFHYKSAWDIAKDCDLYLIRSLLSGAYSGTPDSIINAAVEQIKKDHGFVTANQFAVLRDNNRALEITPQRFFGEGYGSDSIHLLFNWWYRDFNYDPAFKNNLPQVDHIFPQSLLKKVKAHNPDSGQTSLMKYKADLRDQFANCMLLTREENGSGGKTDIPPEQWFANKDDAYLDKHIIPRDRSLLKMERFDEFVTARKALLLEKFKPLLIQTI